MTPTMIVPETLHCRQCGVALSRITGRHRVLTAVCTECSDRQTIRCRVCRSPLEAIPGSDVGRCTAHGKFRLERGGVVQIAPPDVRVAEPTPPIETRLRVRTMMAPDGGSYRDGQARGFELVHRHAGQPVASSGDGPSRASGETIALVLGMLSMLACVAAGMTVTLVPPWARVPVIIAGLSFFFFFFFVLFLIVGVGAIPSHRPRVSRTTSLRVDSERLERTVDGVASTIEMRSVRSVRRLPVAPRIYRVEVELDDRPPVVLLDELGEDESEEVEAIVREQLERRSRT